MKKSRILISKTCKFYQCVKQDTEILSGKRVSNPAEGYGGHEYLKPFGLINMNARLYDPALGRFLSPDPYVQAPDYSQNFNRYSYCLNNPLKYSDPNGENWLLLYLLYCTEAGYQFQKYYSPVAYKVELDFGSHQIGIGLKMGVGISKLVSIFNSSFASKI